MFKALLCDFDDNCREFGPFTSDIAARDWAMEAQELGFLPHTVLRVRYVHRPDVIRLEEPLDLGFDPGL